VAASVNASFGVFEILGKNHDLEGFALNFLLLDFVSRTFWQTRPALLYIYVLLLYMFLVMFVLHGI
jgi:hypothetical protein